MSRRRREERDQRKKRPIPPMNRLVRTMDEVLGQDVIMQVKEYGVAEWHRDKEAKLPAEAVVFHMKVGLFDKEAQVHLYLGSAAAVDELIEMLQRHRNSVWPGVNTNPE